MEEESLANMSLQCLTNLSVTSPSHDNFTKVIQCLYTMMDSHPSRRLNVCRLLVNLSTNSMLVPYMLAAKVNKYRLILSDNIHNQIYILSCNMA